MWSLANFSQALRCLVWSNGWFLPSFFSIWEFFFSTLESRVYNDSGCCPTKAMWLILDYINKIDLILSCTAAHKNAKQAWLWTLTPVFLQILIHRGPAFYWFSVSWPPCPVFPKQTQQKRPTVGSQKMLISWRSTFFQKVKHLIYSRFITQSEIFQGLWLTARETKM